MYDAFKGLYVGFYKQEFHAADSLFTIALQLADSTIINEVATYFYAIKAKENYYFDNKIEESENLLEGLKYVEDWHFLIWYYSMIIDNCYKEEDYSCVNEYTNFIESYCETNNLYEVFLKWDWYYLAWIQKRKGDVLAQNYNNESIDYQNAAKELSHRIKNDLQELNSYLDIQKLKATNEITKQELSKSQQLIVTFGNIHKFLYKNDNPEMVNVQTYFKQFIDDLVSAAPTIKNRLKTNIQISDVKLPTSITKR